ncbi:hypothetical protein B0J12DRAFT_643528 [Macrophomina phaseolina]|uniref:Uncharacterized protein n=1 Tax=Macrophomina phaseolina TaxID=35725 RepID=A0ABQ8GT12_9PEZI|nr:hypothetical protein B0J12DRAFT_643528 [Macrophomina phaseolina]
MEKVCCVWYSIGLIGLVGWVWLRLSREQRQPARHPVYRAAIRSKGGCGCRHLPRSLTSAIELGRGLSGELKRSSSSRRLLDVGGVESCVGKEKEAERKRGQWRHCSSSTCAPISVPGNNGCRAIYYSSGRSNGSFAHRRANAPRVTLLRLLCAAVSSCQQASSPQAIRRDAHAQNPSSAHMVLNSNRVWRAGSTRRQFAPSRPGLRATARLPEKEISGGTHSGKSWCSQWHVIELSPASLSDDVLFSFYRNPARLRSAYD